MKQRVSARVEGPPTHERTEQRTVAVAPRYYLPVRVKFVLTIIAAIVWMAFSIVLARNWVEDLARSITLPGAIIVTTAIAFVPGFINAFLVTSLLLDRRPARRQLKHYPPISVLIAAYNEEKCIVDTINNVMASGYPGTMEVTVIDDGSSDSTVERVSNLNYANLCVIQNGHGGKANALNTGLRSCSHDTIVTIDADTFLYGDALARIVERLESDPPGTAAVAGAVLVRNSRENLVSKMQEWDYFHGIGAVKRAQSLYQGTLVAQGAFSIYRRKELLEAGGWPDKVGEDIVLTWNLLELGNRVGYAEDAIAFTTVPATYRSFFHQRKRWSRGLIEAFRSHPKLLLKSKPTTVFIYWNLLFPLLDATYLVIFVPGVVAALLGHLYVAGPMTLAVLPLALLINYIMYRVQLPMFEAQGLSVRRNFLGLMFYVLLYSIVLNPATIAGYLSEILGFRKVWGTK